MMAAACTVPGLEITLPRLPLPVAVAVLTHCTVSYTELFRGANTPASTSNSGGGALTENETLLLELTMPVPPQVPPQRSVVVTLAVSVYTPVGVPGQFVPSSST